MVGALAQCLREQHISVEYEPPLETRDWSGALALAAVVIAATGNVTDVLTAVDYFRKRFGARTNATVAVETAESPEDRLRILDRLRDEGTITNDEYERHRARILDEI